MSGETAPRMACAKCGEPISVEAAECPHCGDKKWTKDRYQAYQLLFVPATAAVAALILYPLFAMSNPEVTIWWFAGLLVVFYAVGAIMTRQKRNAYLEHLRKAGRETARQDAGE